MTLLSDSTLSFIEDRWPAIGLKSLSAELNKSGKMLSMTEGGGTLTGGGASSAIVAAAARRCSRVWD